MMFPTAPNGLNRSSPTLGWLKLHLLLVRHISPSPPPIFYASRIAQLPCPFNRSWSNVLDGRGLKLRPRRLALGTRHGWLCLISLSLTSKNILRSKSRLNSSTMKQIISSLNDVNLPFPARGKEIHTHCHLKLSKEKLKPNDRYVHTRVYCTSTHPQMNLELSCHDIGLQPERSPVASHRRL